MVMDMSFANQCFSVLHLVRAGKTLENKVYPVPKEIDEEIARLKLASMRIVIDKLTPAQKKIPRGLERRDVTLLQVAISWFL
jgi:adenosylhomocysteinase